MIGQIFAGVGLGLLVGVLVGLSSSPVVSVVVGALATGLTALLGFARSAKDTEPAHAVGSMVRLGSFGFSCTAAVLLGLLIRTHNWASPSIADQVTEVRKAGYSEEVARSWVAYRNIGATSFQFNSPGNIVASNGDHEKPDGGSAQTAGSVLFNSSGSDECQSFDTRRYKDTTEHLNALQLLGGKHAEYAKKISSLDAQHQKMVLDSLRLLFCPQ